MAEQTQRFSITRALQPACYHDFACTGGRCRESCCKYAWRIAFNKKDYLKLKHAPKSSDLAERLAGNVKRLRGEQALENRYAEIDMRGGVCPLLNEEGLCALQIECGEGALPEVCRTFPRITYKTDLEFLERSLSLGCEAVLDLLWNLPDGVDFATEPLSPDKRYEVRTNTAQMPPAILHFGEIRSLCIDMLQARSMPLPSRLLLLGLQMKQLSFSPSLDTGAWLAKSRAMLHDPSVSQTLADIPGDQSLFVANALQVLGKCVTIAGDVSDFAWELLDGTGCVVRLDDPDEERDGERRYQIEYDRLPAYLTRYQAAKQAFDAHFGDLEYFYENLTVMFFFQKHYPVAADGEAPWDSFLRLCTAYHLFRFVSVAACETERTREQLFRALVMAGRAMLHDTVQLPNLTAQLHETGSDTLAHMAILLQD